MNELFLIVALALPLDTKDDYKVLKGFIESRRPQYTVVFIHPDEKLLNPGSVYTGIIVEPRDGSQRLKIWTIKRSA